jgi:hypothetical protein
MPLETSSCTNCGSAEVKEVKTNTYFCEHGETVFKHIYPTGIPVTHYPAFCDCGGQVVAGCASCQRTLCADCDHGDGFGFRSGARVFTTNGGAFCEQERSEGPAPWIGGALLHAYYGCARAGTLPDGVPTRPPVYAHLCGQCAHTIRTEAANSIAELMSDGTICVASDDAICWRPSEAACPCCGRHMCSHHVYSKIVEVPVRDLHHRMPDEAIRLATPKVCKDCMRELLDRSGLMRLSPGPWREETDPIYNAYRKDQRLIRKLKKEWIQAIEAGDAYAGKLEGDWASQVAGTCRATRRFVCVAAVSKSSPRCPGPSPLPSVMGHWQIGTAPLRSRLHDH